MTAQEKAKELVSKFGSNAHEAVNEIILAEKQMVDFMNKQHDLDLTYDSVYWDDVKSRVA